MPVSYTGLPTNRERSTFVSAAMITASADATSSAVSTSLAPTEPWVSTLMVWPSEAAPFRRPSAAMKVWAMPVGHDVMATRCLVSPAVRSTAAGSVGSGAGSGSSTASPGSLAELAARLMTSLVCRIASAVETALTGLPANRLGSTWMSAAMITASARATLSSVRRCLAPSAPWVSTWIE